jgi:hypothetical protein
LRLFSTLRRIPARRPLGASRTCSKRSVCGTRIATTLPNSATSFGEHSRRRLSHVTLMTRRAKPKSTKARTTSKNPTRWSTYSSVASPPNECRRKLYAKSYTLNQ